MDKYNIIKMLETFNDFSSIINTNYDFYQILSAVLDKVLEITGMEKGGIYLRDMQTGDYILTAHSQVSEKFMEKHYRITKEWTSFLPVIDEGKVVTVSDTLLPILHGDPGRQKSVIEEGFRSFVSIPLISEKSIIGILNVSSSKPHEFSDFDIKLFSIIGRQMGSSIKTAEMLEQLRKSKDYYGLMNSARDVIYTHDFDGNFLSMNHAGLDLLECTKEELLQSNIKDFLTDDSLELMRGVNQCLMRGITIQYPPVLEVISKKGKRSFYEFNITPIIRYNKPVGIQGIARNIDKRLLAEKNLLIFTKAINLTKEGISISDADHRITFINEEGARIFGYSKRELIGLSTDILCAREDVQNLRDNAIPAMVKYGYWNGLILGNKRDGTAIPIEITLSSVRDHKGKPQVNICVFREVAASRPNKIGHVPD